jgi:FtsZ-binding cell division protein ZapB
MANITYNANDQVQTLGVKIANLEVENARLSAVYKAADKRIDELEAENQKLKDEQAKNVKTDKPKDSAK